VGEFRADALNMRTSNFVNGDMKTNRLAQSNRHVVASTVPSTTKRRDVQGNCSAVAEGFRRRAAACVVYACR